MRFVAIARSVIFGGATALCACSQTAAPVKSTPPPAAAGAMLQSIRAAGQAMASAVDVQPLRDAAVEGFVEQAQKLEGEGKPAEASQQVDRALRLAPDAPELLQYQAELSIAQGRFAEAEPLARKSYDLGPKLGSLCARNWQTVAELRTAEQDAAGAQSAKAQLATCAVKPPVRM
jgi:hypothetical protein